MGSVTMNLKRIEAFCRVVECGGITPASKVMFCVPSNISKMIKELEEELQSTLFFREKNNLTLTSYGRGYYEEVKVILELSYQIDQKFKGYADNHALNIGALDIAADFYLPPLLERFWDKHERNKVKIFRAYSKKLEKALINGRLDIIFSDGPIKNLIVDCKLAFQEELLLLGDIRIVDKKQIPVFCFGEDCFYNDIAINWVKNQPMGLYIIREIESYPLMTSFINKGLGIGFIPKSIVNACEKFNGMVVNISIPCPIYAIWRKNETSEVINQLIDLL